MPAVRSWPKHYLLPFVAGLILTSCTDPLVEPEIVEPRLEPIAFSELDGWALDDFASALQAFERSCGKIERIDPKTDWGLAGKAVDWQRVCQELPAAGDSRRFFETHFVAHKVWLGKEREGLFTGYYEPLLFGARQPGGRYTIPIRQRPSDLITLNLGDFSEDLKGKRLAGRINGQKLVPYADRAAIDAGAIDDKSDTLLWVDDSIAKFFLQIQGSGQVQLAGGDVVRVGYAAQNGHAYRAIGRDLIERGELTRENVSLQSIRQWLLDHPDQADELMHKNASYVFFRELSELNGESGPLGSQNVPLEPERSLAVDRKFWPMGMPIWLDVPAPLPRWRCAASSFIDCPGYRRRHQRRHSRRCVLGSW